MHTAVPQALERQQIRLKLHTGSARGKHWAEKGWCHCQRTPAKHLSTHTRTRLTDLLSYMLHACQTDARLLQMQGLHFRSCDTCISALGGFRSTAASDYRSPVLPVRNAAVLPRLCLIHKHTAGERDVHALCVCRHVRGQRHPEGRVRLVLKPSHACETLRIMLKT